MRGHITKRGKNSWSIVLSLGRDPSTGKRQQQWVSVKGTRKDVEHKLAELLHQVETGGFVRPTKLTVGQFLERWLKDYAKPSLTGRSFERYENIVKLILPLLGGLILTQLRPEHLQRLYAAKLSEGLTCRTVRYYHTVLHKALQTALKWGLVSRNAADGVDVPRSRGPEMQTWTENEMARFLEAARNMPHYGLFYTALFTGMRRSELLALKWSDVDLLFGHISVSRSLHHLRDGSYVFSQPKSAKSKRSVALSPSTIAILRKHREKQGAERIMLGVPLTDDSLVFSTIEGNPLRPETVSRAWTRTAASAGVKVIRFHDARHTHATILLKQGVHPKVVQERLGHATIGVTLDLYSHTVAGLQEAAAMRFDEALTARYNEPVAETVAKTG